MARPLSWLPRLHEIRKRVSSSVRSHYTRAELQDAFQIQARAASALLAILPTVKVGTAYLVKREDLIAFLDRVHESEDVPALLEEVRAEKAGVSRRKLRALVLHDVEPPSLIGMPDNLKLSVGRVEIEWSNGEELLRALVNLAMVMQGDGIDEFLRLYEPITEPAEVDGGADDVRALFEELEEMEAKRREGHDAPLLVEAVTG